jgi:hypothetical protein
VREISISALYVLESPGSASRSIIYLTDPDLSPAPDPDTSVNKQKNEEKP